MQTLSVGTHSRSNGSQPGARGIEITMGSDAGRLETGTRIHPFQGSFSSPLLSSPLPSSPEPSSPELISPELSSAAGSSDSGSAGVANENDTSCDGVTPPYAPGGAFVVYIIAPSFAPSVRLSPGTASRAPPPPPFPKKSTTESGSWTVAAPPPLVGASIGNAASAAADPFEMVRLRFDDGIVIVAPSGMASSSRRPSWTTAGTPGPSSSPSSPGPGLGEVGVGAPPSAPAAPPPPPPPPPLWSPA